MRHLDHLAEELGACAAGDVIREALASGWEPFLTGSRAYGTPKETSDVDIVLFIPQGDVQILVDKINESRLLTGLEPVAAGGGYGASLRFGNINLICLRSIEEFFAWKAATEELVKRRPVTRDQAVAMIERFIEIAKRPKLEYQP